MCDNCVQGIQRSKESLISGGVICGQCDEYFRRNPKKFAENCVFKCDRGVLRNKRDEEEIFSTDKLGMTLDSVKNLKGEYRYCRCTWPTWNSDPLKRWDPMEKLRKSNAGPIS